MLLIIAMVLLAIAAIGLLAGGMHIIIEHDNVIFFAFGLFLVIVGAGLTLTFLVALGQFILTVVG